MPRVSRDIDARLADLDRRLREIQEELLPGREPRPAAAAPADEPPPPAPADEERPAPGDEEPAAPGPLPPSEPPAPPEPPPPPPPPPPPSSAPPPPLAPPPPPPPAWEPATTPLTELHAKLLASFRQLLDAYEWLLAQTAQTPAPPPTPSQPVGIAAGPFQSTVAVREFEAALAALPGVRAVSVRGYEGDDRAIFDLEMVDSTAPRAG